VSDDRWTDEEKAAHEAAKLIPIPKPAPCRRYVEQPAVSAEEVEEFLKELESK
jgi:hypothetical protein